MSVIITPIPDHESGSPDLITHDIVPVSPQRTDAPTTIPPLRQTSGATQISHYGKSRIIIFFSKVIFNVKAKYLLLLFYLKIVVIPFALSHTYHKNSTKTKPPKYQSSHPPPCPAAVVTKSWSVSQSHCHGALVSRCQDVMRINLWP